MKNSMSTPPRLAEIILSRICRQDLLEEIIGDLYEYHEELADLPPWKRRIIFWFHAFHFIRPNLIRSFSGTRKLNYYGMFKIYSKSALRGLLKHRLTTSVSLISLILGAVCFHLVYVWVNNEEQMDKFHSNYDNIYMSQAKFNANSDFEPLSLQMFFRVNFQEFADIQKSLMIHVYYEGQIKFIADHRDFQGKGFVADSTFFSFFDFKLQSGDRDHILEDPSNVILSHEFARRVFGDVNPVGKTIQIKCDQKGSYKVAGVMEPIPSNSSISFDFLIPRHSKSFWSKIPQEFILPDPSFDLGEFNSRIEKMGQQESRFPESTLAVIPFSTLYYQHDIDLSLFEKYGERSTLTAMKFIGLSIVLITLLCFTGLQATHHLSLVKKTGIKQVIGATKKDLFFEIVVSRLFYLVISTVIAFGLFHVIFPYYVSIMEVDIDPNHWLNFSSIVMVIVTIVGLSTIVITIQLFKVEVKEALGNKLVFLQVPTIQRMLTTIQYAVTITLLIATVVVYTQFTYMTNKDTGLDDQNVISVDFIDMWSRGDSDEESEARRGKFQFLISEMQKNPTIVGFSQGEMPVHAIANPASWKRVGSPEDYTSQNNMVADPGYEEILGMEVIRGRFFSDSLDKSRENKVVINEAAFKYWGFTDLSDAKLANVHWGGEEDPFKVIGVVRDYHYEHLSKKIKPLVLVYFHNSDENFLIKAQPGKLKECLASLEKLYFEVNPRGIFDFDLLDVRVEAQYMKEKQTGKVYLAFTVIALILSFVGLFTFALHETRRRTKEIGIRKINGAGIRDVFSLLSMSFMKSVAIAFILAGPVSWFLMDQWLQNFAYRTELSGWMFVLAGLVSFITALLAVSWQTLETAKKNPVESLRYE